MHDSRDEKAQRILALMTDELKSLRQSCKAVGVATSTFILWTQTDEDLSEQYAKARDALIDGIADDIMDISDLPPPIKADGSLDSAGVAHQRLRVDTRKWLLSKLAPKRYGERIEVDGNMTVSPVLDLLVAMAKPVEQK
jgi:hypothetical protein